MTKSKLSFCNENQLIQEEKERLRKLRIIQVREISKQNAAKVREAFKREKDKEIKNLQSKHEHEKKQEKQENFNEIKQLVQKQLDNIGQGHLSAANYDDQTELKKKQAIENDEKALIRGKAAMGAHIEERMAIENKENAHIIARKFALEQEKLRSNQIAKLPKPVDDSEPIPESKPTKLVSLHDANAFMTTRYHMPAALVDKAAPTSGNCLNEDIDARKEAVNEEARQKMLEQEQSRSNQERAEKARLRGKHALEKEILNENYNEIMDELSVLQKADREKRQKELINIPKEIFLPSWQRQQEKNEHQLELERQFEKIYVDANLRREEMPEPADLKELELSQSNMADAELDLTLLDDLAKSELQIEPIEEMDCADNAVKQVTSSITSITAPMTANQAEGSQAWPDGSNNSTLKLLLDKIRKQKEDVAQKSSNLNDISIDSSVSELSENANKTTEQQQQQQTSLFTLTQENKLDQDETLVSEHDTTLLSDLDSIPSRDNEKKLIKGIMMSSHNVSSLNEIENHRALLNAKIISANNRRGVEQTEKCSALDLSHASKDPMVAGPSELFRKNDLKLMIELKNKKLLEQQTELERKLKELELKEAEIEKAAQNKPASLISAGAGADSGNDHNYCSESIDNSSILTTSNSIKEPQLSLDDLKRIEYQKSLLMSIDKARSAKISDELSSATSSSGCFVEQIEERKKEILKRFGIEAQLNCSKKPPPSTTSSSQQLNAAQNDDKHTIYSSDSGFASGSNCYYNMNYRPALSSVKKPINLAVEKLNDEIANKRFGFNASSILNAQQQQDLVNYLSGDIDEDEYKRRMSNSSFNLSSFSFLNKSGSQLEQKQQLSRLFGLEFFDSSNNMSDIRDSSIEQMIGWSLNSTQQQQQEKFNTKSTQPMSSASTNSNDTSNDEDDDASFKTKDKVESDDTIETLEEEDEEEDENSQALIMSLLNSRQVKALPKPVELSSIEFMRQSIQEQLEAVRKQKEQLQMQSSKLAPPIRAHKLMGECNLHELSTIKEVDTPISERNLKLTSKGLNSSVGNRSMGNINDVSSALSSSSLENVTQLSENLSNATSQIGKSNQQQFGLAYQQQQKQNSFGSISPGSFTNDSTSDYDQLTSQQQQKLISVDQMRQKQMQLFNLSLFDSSVASNTSTNSLISPYLTHNNESTKTTLNNNNNSTNQNMIEYGAKIFDSLSSNNLTINASTPAIASSLNYSNIATNLDFTNKTPQLKQAFKTESTNVSVIDSAMLFNSNKKFNLNSLNSSSINKTKWFDILASSATEDEDKSESTTISCGLLSSTSLNTSKTNSLTQYSISKTSLGESSCLEKTLQPINSPPKKLIQPKQTINESNSSSSVYTSSTSGVAVGSLSTTANTTKSNKNNNNGTGLFDRFLKNYNSSSSVMDEPELSFVSCSSSSDPVTPRQNRTDFSSAQQQTRSNMSTFSNNTISNASCSYSNNSQPGSTSGSQSLISLQKKQLNREFGDMSPIDQNLSNHMNNLKAMQSFSATILFDPSKSSQKQNDDEEEEEEQYDEENELKSSLVLLSPNKLYNEKTGSLIHGLIEDETLSCSLIEGALNAPFDMSTMNQQLKNMINKAEDSKSSIHEMSSNKKTINTTESTDKRSISPNLLTCVSSFSTNSSSNQKSDSLISFERHEQRDESKLSNISSLDELTSAYNTKIAKLFSSVTQKSQNSSSQSPICNSTPLVAIRRPSLCEQSSLDSEQIKKYLENANSSSSIFFSNNKNKIEYLSSFEDDTDCENLKSEELADMPKKCSCCLYSKASLNENKIRVRVNELARNVTQESYFLDFSGRVTQLSRLGASNNDLQKACYEHFKRLYRNKKLF